MNALYHKALKSPMRAWELIRAIHNEIPGEKIFSIKMSDDEETFNFDMSSNGTVGYEDAHKILFLHKITCAMKQGGKVLIKQFLSIPLRDHTMEMREGPAVNSPMT